eukprot:1290305-Ditylum_brightwellii.AAC.1
MPTQSGLIDKIIEALGLEDAMGVEAPAEFAPLGKDLFGDKGNATFNYLSVTGMILYLSSHSQPDIQYAVLHCAHFSSNSKASHEAALKRISRYLKEMRNKGLTLRDYGQVKHPMISIVQEAALAFSLLCATVLSFGQASYKRNNSA